MDDLLLVEASQAGHKAAFSVLIDRYYRNVYRLAYQYTGRHHEADDICQEAFLRAFGAIGSLREGGSFKGWIFTIASNLLRRRIKDMKVERRLAARGASTDATESAADGDAGPSAKMAAEERTVIVRRQVQEMPEQIRLAAILILMEGLSQKEAAAVLGCSEATVCRRLEAAREWLKPRLRNLI
ncbi:MAG TPA: sigma-70 family RNA polymerase sigma factor [Sedimentisphaerales bacterium]|nr:sigma-70 family RNA polymerase sigma factor [Sedimentisphaerales bacterium]